jgi:hypothetical protein
MAKRINASELFYRTTTTACGFATSLGWQLYCHPFPGHGSTTAAPTGIHWLCKGQQWNLNLSERRIEVHADPTDPGELPDYRQRADLRRLGRRAAID